MITAKYRKHIFLFILATCLLWACTSPSVHAQSFEDLTYLTEEYYPFNYTERGIVKGISADLLRMIWDELGVAHQTIEAIPWARAYDSLRHTPLTVLFSMARTEEREGMFKWAGPIYVGRFVLIAKKEKKISLTNLDDLAGYSVGTLRKDISDTILEKYKKIATIDAVADMEQNIKKLLSDRLDMVAYEEHAWHKIITRLKLLPDDFETVYVLHETPIYYAFHKETSSELVCIFQYALNEIKARPAYQQLLDKYLD